MTHDLYYPHCGDSWLDAFIDSGLLLPCFAGFVLVLLLVAAISTRPAKDVPKLFEKIKGRWTNGEYDFLIYYNCGMQQTRIRVIEKLMPEHDGDEPDYAYNDYLLRFRGRKVDFHNGQIFVRIKPLSKGELRMYPGSVFTRTPELYPETTKEYSHVWNR